MARGLRLLSGQSKAAQESAGARLRPHKVMKVAGHAHGPETPEQGHSCARAHRAHSACVLSSTSQCRAFLRPPLRDPNSHAHSRQLPLSRERGPAAGRQAQRRPDRSPLSCSPLPGGSGSCSSRAPGPRGGRLPVQTGRGGAPPPSRVSLSSAHPLDSPCPTFGCHPLPGNRGTPQIQ